MQGLELFSNSRIQDFMLEYGNFDNHAVSWKRPQTLASVVVTLFYTKNWHAELEFCRLVWTLLTWSYVGLQWYNLDLFRSYSRIHWSKQRPKEYPYTLNNWLS